MRRHHNLRRSGPGLPDYPIAFATPDNIITIIKMRFNQGFVNNIYSYIAGIFFPTVHALIGYFEVT